MMLLGLSAFNYLTGRLNIKIQQIREEKSPSPEDHENTIIEGIDQYLIDHNQIKGLPKRNMIDHKISYGWKNSSILKFHNQIGTLLGFELFEDLPQ